MAEYDRKSSQFTHTSPKHRQATALEGYIERECGNQREAEATAELSTKLQHPRTQSDVELSDRDPSPAGANVLSPTAAISATRPVTATSACKVSCQEATENGSGSNFGRSNPVACQVGLGESCDDSSSDLVQSEAECSPLFILATAVGAQEARPEPNNDDFTIRPVPPPNPEPLPQAPTSGIFQKNRATLLADSRLARYFGKPLNP